MTVLRSSTLTVFLAAMLLTPFHASATSEPQDNGSDSTEQGDGARKTIPYTLPWDDMPIDLSFVYEKDKPAGNHGFLRVVGDRFIFDDGTEARFWGTNFNSAQSFPSHDHSEKVAKRLAKIGVNMVRFHQLDAEWSTPNIFQFTKGQNKPNTLTLDAESLDRLDYLIHCLKQEGIYTYMDLLTYRRFKTGDGIDAAIKLSDGAKPYSIFDRRLIELQKQFNHDLWTHTNPYTTLAYMDDPAIALAAIANENDLFSKAVTQEPYRTKFEAQYREWAADRGIEVGKGRVTFDKAEKSGVDVTQQMGYRTESAAEGEREATTEQEAESARKHIQAFLVDVTKAYYEEMIQDMRDTGVKIPIAGTNWSRNVAHLSAQVVADFTDSHAYWYKFGIWKAGDKSFQNESMTGSVKNMLPRLAFYRLSGKPFFVSEWDNPWPNEWRAESSLLLAAAGALQGWGGYCIHTYRYTKDEDVRMLAKPMTGDAIGGVYYRGGVFDTFNDPAKFGLFYHAALITRRGDVRASDKTIDVRLDDLDLGSGINALQLTPEQQRVEMVLPGAKGKGDSIASPGDFLVDVDKGEVLSDTKELYRNLKKQFGWIDSPNTKAVYGFVGKEGSLELTNVRIDVKTDFATVAISTLTDEPISSSTNMLLTAVGRAYNTDSKFRSIGEGRAQQLELGHGPIQIEVIEAAIEIETDKADLRVMSINPQGFITGYIPATFKDGIFRFEIGNEYQSMYYLIQTH